jgi:hypothetical protein
VTASSHAQFGTVPEWIAAIGTTLAFFVAFTVLALDLKERHRRQASRVAAWLERGRPDATLHVANSSEEPIYDVRATPQIFGGDYEPYRLPVLGPGKDDTSQSIPVPRSQEMSNEYLGVEMLFADSAGRRWKRRRDGTLRRKWRSYR